MNKDPIHTDLAPPAVGPYSQAIALSELIFTSGQIPLNPAGTIEGQNIEQQSEQVLQNLKAVLETGDSSLENVLKTTCYLSDMGHFAAFNKVYARYFQEPFPARSCFAVKNLPMNVLVEVEAIAYRNGKTGNNIKS